MTHLPLYMMWQELVSQCLWVENKLLKEWVQNRQSPQGCSLSCVAYADLLLRALISHITVHLGFSGSMQRTSKAPSAWVFHYNCVLWQNQTPCLLCLKSGFWLLSKKRRLHLAFSHFARGVFVYILFLQSVSSCTYREKEQGEREWKEKAGSCSVLSAACCAHTWSFWRQLGFTGRTDLCEPLGWIWYVSVFTYHASLK